MRQHFQSAQALATSLVPLFTALTIVGLFFFRDGQAHNFATYLLSLILLVLPETYKILAILLGNATFRLICLFLALFAVSSGTDYISNFGTGALILTFLIATSFCGKHYGQHIRLFLYIFLIAACSSVLIGLINNCMQYGWEALIPGYRRLGVWFGRSSHAVIAGITFGAASIIAIILLRYTNRFYSKSLLAFAAILLIYAMSLTLSSGPVIAFIATLVIRTFIKHNVLRAETVITSLVVFICLCVLTTHLFLTHIYPEQSGSVIQYFEPGKPNSLQLSDIKSAYDSNDHANIKASSRGLSLSSETDPTIGATWPAFQVSAENRYKVSIHTRASVNTDGGFYLKIESSDDLPDNYKHIATSSGSQHTEEPSVWLADRSLTLVSEGKLNTEFSQYNFYYYPETSTKWASVLVLNWGRMNTHALEISKLEVTSSPISPFEATARLLAKKFSLNFQPDTSSIFARMKIWQSSIERTLSGPLIFGHGLSYPEVTSKQGFELLHSHNMFVSAFYQGGVVGLCLLIGILLSAFRRTNSQNSLECEFAFTIIIFTLVSSFVDIPLPVLKVNYLWIIFWLPIGLAIARTENL